ncbi:hypothetical protein G7048_15450 [Diaphorobacter sp. HDW4B]|uniref:hypothetical protein n=1 Tax=Diaphorobacter sp. HDW4B TaxID=2714925 RepID=UPI00140B7D1B|nr:hypothetical protein [Diaphorobacter sp. HDW4B]QIL71626.1 hypothetical protein G7048_15450 [Diaphorobacter sp. HDW4B]
MKLNKASLVLVVMASVLTLTACSGEPSEGDISTLLKKDLEATNEQMKLLSKDLKMQTTLHSVKKVGCKSDGEKAYLCDVEIDVEAPMVGRRKAVAPIRLVKGSDGWVTSNAR